MRGETYECGISGGPVLSTLHCFDCHDIMCLNTVNPPPPLHPPCTHKDFPFSFLLQRCRASTEASLLLTPHIWLFIQFSFHPPPPPPCFGLPTSFTLITALLQKNPPPPFQVPQARFLTLCTVNECGSLEEHIATIRQCYWRSSVTYMHFFCTVFARNHYPFFY